jgi:hypothetical protein
VNLLLALSKKRYCLSLDDFGYTTCSLYIAYEGYYGERFLVLKDVWWFQTDISAYDEQQHKTDLLDFTHLFSLVSAVLPDFQHFLSAGEQYVTEGTPSLRLGFDNKLT